MPSIRIPTPLRPYTGGNSEVSVTGETVGAALENLTAQHPDLRKHLYSEAGELRAFVNVFLGQEDVRHLQGVQTPLKDGDQLRIVPSVAGGSEATLQKVDHNALRTNQAFIISLLVLAFVLFNSWLVAFVALGMTLGTILRGPGFKPAYQFFKGRNWLKPDVVADNPEPHLFSQGLGAAFLIGSTVSLFAGAALLGWVLAWIVIALASLNLFGGFCAGCFVYYWLNKVHVPGFVKTPPPNTFPGLKPKS